MKRVSTLVLLGCAVLLATSSAHAERYVIQVSNSLTFNPRRVDALPGDQIVWIWSGSFPHSVTEDKGLFDSNFHVAPFGFRRIFNRPGDYYYHCTVHGSPGGVGMSGAVHIGSRDHDDDDEDD